MPRYNATSQRLDDERIVAMIADRDTGDHMLRFRNGGLATDLRLSNRAMLAVVELFFVLHGDHLTLAPAKKGELDPPTYWKYDPQPEKKETTSEDQAR